jgi:Arc/MetJ-type ribon-helix-helix transcriptional regulator
MSKKQYSTRLPQDRAEELDQHCEDTGLSKSEVLRRSIEQHLDDDQDGANDQDGDRDETRLAWWTVTGVGISAILVSQISLFETRPFVATLISVSIYVTLLVHSYRN